MPIDFSLVRPYGGMQLLARQLVEGYITGLHKSPFHGFSVEFAEHKAYNPGEGLRYVDWKLFGRTDRLYTRRFEEETNLRALLLVDASASMYLPEPGRDKLRFATVAASALAYMMYRQRDAVGLRVFAGETIEQLRVRSTGVHIRALLASLERTLDGPPPGPGAARGTELATALHEAAETLGQRSLVVILSDMWQPGAEQATFEGLQHLRHNRHEVILFHVHDGPTELALDLPERPTVFEDVETGRKIEATPGQIRQAYRAAYERWLADLRERCGQYRIDFVPADVSAGVNPILQAYLAKRARMH